MVPSNHSITATLKASNPQRKHQTMRMQSPASTGLLPATYSRRRRNRNETPPTGTNSTYQEVMDVEIPPGHHGSPHQRISPQKLYKNDKSSFDENDENDEHCINQTRSVRPCPYEEGYEDVLPKPPPLSDFLVNDRNY